MQCALLWGQGGHVLAGQVCWVQHILPGAHHLTSTSHSTELSQIHIGPHAMALVYKDASHSHEGLS